MTKVNYNKKLSIEDFIPGKLYSPKHNNYAMFRLLNFLNTKLSAADVKEFTANDILLFIKSDLISIDNKPEKALSYILFLAPDGTLVWDFVSAIVNFRRIK